MACHDSQDESKAKRPIRINYLIQISIYSKIIDSARITLLDSSIGRDLAYPRPGLADAAAFQSNTGCNAMISTSINKFPHGSRRWIRHTAGFLRRAGLFGIVTIAALAALTAVSHASTLIGNVIEAQYEFPSIGTPYVNSTVLPNPFAVGAGIDAVIDVENVTQLSIDFSASSLLITMTTSRPSHSE